MHKSQEAIKRDIARTEQLKELIAEEIKNNLRIETKLEQEWGYGGETNHCITVELFYNEERISYDSFSLD